MEGSLIGASICGYALLGLFTLMMRLNRFHYDDVPVSVYVGVVIFWPLIWVRRIILMVVGFFKALVVICVDFFQYFSRGEI